MNTLCAGFSRVNITPMLGIELAGYLEVRKADGILDELQINTLALSCGLQRVLLMSVDNLGMNRLIANEFQTYIAELTGVPVEAIFISATHTHTAPRLKLHSEVAEEQEYYQMMRRKMADAARLALADLKPARMGYGTGLAPGIAFIRRYRMKDGSVQTNPGVGNPNVLKAIGDVDERVNVLRFDQDSGSSIVLVNFGVHPDTVGGSKISADYPGFLRTTIERSLDHTKCVFFNGAQGDVNHVNVWAKGGDFNDLHMDFDSMRGYGHTRYMGRVLAGAVFQAYDKVRYVEVDQLHYLQKTIQVPSNMPAPEEMEEARRIAALYDTGRQDELPYRGMLRTTMVADAKRKIRLEHGPETFTMKLSGVSIGKIAFVGIPGEPFTGIGLALKSAESWDMVLPCCQTNGAQGYFPMKQAYDEGGYEACNSSFKAGVAEFLIEEGMKLLHDLRAEVASC